MRSLVPPALAARSPGRRAATLLLLTCVALVVSQGPLSAAPAVTGPTVRAVAGPTPAPPAPRVSGSQARSDPDFVDLPARCTDETGYPALGPCRVLPRKPGAPTIVLWGDSHAWQVLPAVRKAIGDRRVNLVSWIMGGCPPMYPVIRPRSSPSPSNGCDGYGNQVMDWLRAKKQRGERFRLVVATSWELYHDVTDEPTDLDERYPGTTNDWIAENARRALSAMPRMFRTLGALRIPTDVVGQMPMVYLGAPPCAHGTFQCDLPRAGVLKDPGENNARAQQLRRYLPRPVRGRLIRPARTLCDDTVCRGRLGGVPVYFDRLHIGQRTSVRLASYFTPTVDAVQR